MKAGDWGHREVYGVSIKRDNFRETIRTFNRDKRNCVLSTGVRRAGLTEARLKTKKQSATW